MDKRTINIIIQKYIQELLKNKIDKKDFNNTNPFAKEILDSGTEIIIS